MTSGFRQPRNVTTVGGMRVKGDEEYWKEMKRRTSSEVSAPPWAVMLAAAALVGDQAIVGSWTVYEPTKPPGSSTWKEYLATADRLIYVEVNFSDEMYNLEEDVLDYRRNAVASKIIAAWSRRLSDIAQLHIGRCAKWLPKDGPRDWFALADVKLVFTNGDSIALPVDQFSLDSAKTRERIDEFINAVRAGARL